MITGGKIPLKEMKEYWQDEAWLEGWNEGLAQGMDDGIAEVAKAMKAEGIVMDTISVKKRMDQMKQNEPDLDPEKMSPYMRELADMVLGRDTAKRTTPTHWTPEERYEEFLDGLRWEFSGEEMKDEWQEEAKSKGLKKGREEGLKESKRETARAMKAESMDTAIIAIIARITGLPEDDIRRL